MIAGCLGGPGVGPTNLKVGELKVGGEAKLVSPDGSDVILDRIVRSPSEKSAQRVSRSNKTEKLKLPVGTIVLIQDVVGDDALVVINNRSSSEAHCWVECLRLEPLAR